MHSDVLDEAVDEFVADGFVAKVLYPIKSGKEAVVYCCSAGEALDAQFVAAKVYKPKAFRAFQHDAPYREGRVILDQRARRAAARRTDFGREVSTSLWTNHEWQTLSSLYRAGADVPQPLARSGGAILLEFLGDAEGPAPVLKDVELAPAEAERVFDRLLENVELWLGCNIVHGDLSAYNVLYWQGEARAIDFPQSCDPRFNSNAFQLLVRDVENLARYFARFGVERDGYALADRFWSAWERPYSRP